MMLSASSCSTTYYALLLTDFRYLVPLAEYYFKSMSVAYLLITTTVFLFLRSRKIQLVFKIRISTANYSICHETYIILRLCSKLSIDPQPFSAD